jgi:filamentous hemagglutinin family protein
MNMNVILFFKKPIIIAVVAMLTMSVSGIANAQSAISMDGSTGTGTGANQNFNVPGAHPVIVINGDGPNANGTQSGSNLFFSFSQFGIAAGDTALFQCPGGCAGVTNVISRVTANSANSFIPPHSLFDGTLTSIIGHANFWFFNPAGVTLNGTINIPLGATYHISNADGINFSGNGGNWTAFPSQTANTLSSAPPASFFGFEFRPITITGTNINPETPISTIVSKTVVESVKPVLNIAQMNNGSTLELSKKPCDNRSKSTLISKGVANYIPELSSQVTTSVLTTTGSNSSATSEQTSALALAEDDCQ